MSIDKLDGMKNIVHCIYSSVRVGENICACNSLLCTSLHFPAVRHQHLINIVINAQTDAMVVKDAVITLWLSSHYVQWHVK